MATKRAPSRSTKASKSTELVRQEDKGGSVGFTRVEKNLASLGFFTPSSKKTKGLKSKSITVTRVIGGKRVQARATILPAAEYGLPITADQDKYLAFLKIVGEMRMRQGKVVNPVSFSTAELLRLLGSRVQTGKNYSDIEEWLKRMTVTSISSDGVVYFAGRKRWASDTFHVFERATSFGNELPDGTIADKNYVWLSEWQLENINNNHVLPVDLDAYLQVKNHIAKALVPLLQIWLYASRADGAFEKRYAELCEILNIRKYRHLSDMRRKLEPSLLELKSLGYLSDYAIRKTADRTDYKVIFFHGERFREDRHRRASHLEEPRRLATEERVLESGSVVEEKTEEDGDEQELLLNALVARGVSKRRASELAEEAEEPEEALDQVEWFDHLAERKTLDNPPGLLVHLLEENVRPPESFGTSRRRRSAQEATHQPKEDNAEWEAVATAYEIYRESAVEKHIREVLGEKDHQRRIEERKAELRSKYPVLRGSPDKTLSDLAQRSVREEIEKELSVMSLDAFCEEWRRRRGER